MSNELATQKNIRDYFNNPAVKNKFEEVLGKKSQGFIISVLSITAQNDLLAKADPASVVNAAMTAATLDLPINQNLGFAYIIPYNDRKSNQVLAQFQMGYKGFIQLAMRSGQFMTINATDIRQGEIKEINRLTGEIAFDWILDSDVRNKLPIVGYVSYMKLVNGFVKYLYMTETELKAHGVRFSQSMKRGYGLWKDDFDAMAKKTVLKLLLSKYAPLTTEMQKAQLADQAIIKGDDEFEYIDNKKESPEQTAAIKERERIQTHIKESKTLEELAECAKFIDDEETNKLYADKMKELEAKKK